MFEVKGSSSLSSWYFSKWWISYSYSSSPWWPGPVYSLRQGLANFLTWDAFLECPSIMTSSDQACDWVFLNEGYQCEPRKCQFPIQPDGLQTNWHHNPQIQEKITPKSGNLFPPFTHPSIHSSLLIIPSLSLSNISTTIFVMSSFFPLSISFAVSSSRP